VAELAGRQDEGEEIHPDVLGEVRRIELTADGLHEVAADGPEHWAGMAVVDLAAGFLAALAGALEQGDEGGVGF